MRQTMQKSYRSEQFCNGTDSWGGLSTHFFLHIGIRVDQHVTKPRTWLALLEVHQRDHLFPTHIRCQCLLSLFFGLTKMSKLLLTAAWNYQQLNSPHFNKLPPTLIFSISTCFLHVNLLSTAMFSSFFLLCLQCKFKECSSMQNCSCLIISHLNRSAGSPH